MTKIPECCKICYYYETDYNEYSDVWYHYCLLNIFLPTKKQTCKRQFIPWYPIDQGD